MSFRLSVLPLLAIATLVRGASAQSSQFGARGLGFPLRPLSVRATATGGAFGLFDEGSAFNPASIGLLTRLTTSFQTVQNWRHSESPAGTGNARDNRYPGIFIGGPIGGTRLVLSLSASGYTDRNFQLASQDTLILRDQPVAVLDTLSSQGGISDLRLAVAWRQSRSVQWGVGLHMLTGSNRITSHRVFSDTTFSGVKEGNTISYLGFGVSAGVTARWGKVITVAGLLRADDRMHVQRDTTDIGTTHLPITASGGVKLQLGERLQVAGGATFRNWSVADPDLVKQGGIGSTNTTEFAAGLEFATNKRRPFQRPIRLGVFHARLPFQLKRGEDADETGISLGTSLRFVADRAALDLALDRIWRKGAPGFTERAILLTAGVSIRP
jgi:hypothetical protein